MNTEGEKEEKLKIQLKSAWKKKVNRIEKKEKNDAPDVWNTYKYN